MSSGLICSLQMFSIVKRCSHAVGICHLTFLSPPGVNQEKLQSVSPRHLALIALPTLSLIFTPHPGSSVGNTCASTPVGDSSRGPRANVPVSSQGLQRLYHLKLSPPFQFFLSPRDWGLCIQVTLQCTAGSMLAHLSVPLLTRFPWNSVLSTQTSVYPGCSPERTEEDR